MKENGREQPKANESVATFRIDAWATHEHNFLLGATEWVIYWELEWESPAKLIFRKY